MLQLPLIAGFALGVSLAAPPGPIIALMAHATPREGWRAGLIIGVGAMSGDALYLILAALGAATVLTAWPSVVGVLALVGAALMLFFAYGAWQSGKRGLRSVEKTQFTRRNPYVAGFLLALTSPYNLAWWAGSGLPLVGILGPSVLVGFFAGILATVIAYVALFAWGSKKVPGFARAIGYASAVLLVAFAGYFAWSGWQSITG